MDGYGYGRRKDPHVAAVWTGPQGSAGWRDYYGAEPRGMAPRYSGNDYSGTYRGDVPTVYRNSPYDAKKPGGEQSESSNGRGGLVAGIVIITMLLVGAIIALAVILTGGVGIPGPFPTPNPNTTLPPISPDTHVPLELTVTRTDLPYVDALADPDSAVFAAFEQIFCEQIRDIAEGGDLDVDVCKAEKMSSGSVVSELQAEIRMQENMDAAETRDRFNTQLQLEENRNDMFEVGSVTVNYCIEDDDVCEQVCTNSADDGEETVCACYPGYTLNNDGSTCEDINECSEDPPVCPPGQSCDNTDGSFECLCPEGFMVVDDDRRGCEDIDECRETGRCQFGCTNTDGSYMCTCPGGYVLDGNGVTCSDLDECSMNGTLCAQNCENIPGDFTCSCNDGYVLGGDGLSCQQGGIMVEVEPTRLDLIPNQPPGTQFLTCIVTLTGTVLDDTQGSLDEVDIGWMKGEQYIQTLVEEVDFGVFNTSFMFPFPSPFEHGRYACVAKAAGLDERAFASVYFTNPGGCGLFSTPCADMNGCFSVLQSCDGIPHCQDGSDELGCGCTYPGDTTQFVCDAGNCVNIAYVCDTDNDCGDWSDETNCTTLCETPGYVECDLGVCVPEHYLCDGKPDCPNHSDESDCMAPCSVASQVECDGKCLSSSFQCDGEFNCIDKSDEAACPQIDCYQCMDQSLCVPVEKYCDGILHCPDGSDESDGCERHMNMTGIAGNRDCLTFPCLLECPDPINCVCPHPYTTLEGTLCVFTPLLCDGREQFPGNALDEAAGCSDACPWGHYKCDNKCVFIDTRCDGFRNCIDGSDEAGCSCDAADNKFLCQTGMCLPLKVYCDGVIDCVDGSDEPANCETGCPSGFSRCMGIPGQTETPVPAECVANSKICDNKVDCSTNSDEFQCDCQDLLQCADMVGCFPQSGLCDMRYADCPDVSDERELCVPDSGCPRGQFLCDGSCLSISFYCDGEAYCEDGSDEPEDCLGGCKPGSVYCDDRCLATALTCDGKADCSNGEDEHVDACGCDTEHQCSNGMCLESGRFCDGAIDCPDGTDERERCLPQGGVCPDTMHMCDDRCISHALVCDGRLHCKDASDETGCSAKGCNTETTASVYRAYFAVRNANNVRPGVFNTSCADGTCISFDKWCNGRVDCADGSDEAENCNIACPPDSFQCANDACIPSMYRCDGIDDCYDFSDEVGCECPYVDEEMIMLIFGDVREFKACPGGKGCIPSTSFCNGFPDCPDGSDESAATCCTEDKFHCLSGDQCVNGLDVCDEFVDCRDASDELFCAQPCSGDFECNNGRCVFSSQLCDGFNDCGDWSDEWNAGCNCTAKERQCAVGPCLPAAFWCDGRPQCPGGDDEDGCKNCVEGEGTCSNGYCIAEDKLCDGSNDCGDWSDETACDCGDDEFTCDDGVCQPNVLWCDRARNCPDGSDEKEGCGEACKPGQIPCDGRCLDVDKVCDGVRHCSNYTDERDCTCPWGTFQCKDKSFCPHVIRFCDGIYDCPDHSDEPDGCLEDCPAGHYLCSGECRDIEFICQFPDLCPEIVRDLECSSRTGPSGHRQTPSAIGMCGVPTMRPAGEVVPFIVDGEKATPASYPWQVVLELDFFPFTGEHFFRFICSGSIIDRHWVLTAAHCVQFPGPFRVVAGIVDKSINSPTAQIRMGAEVIEHEQYDDNILINDIALIRVAEPFEFNDYVSPICLSSTNTPAGTLCTLSGWGRALGTNEEYTLNQINIPMLDHGECAERMKSALPVTEDMVCAGKYERDGTGCQGDSGGPLICPRAGRYVLEGVVSWGFAGCKYAQAATVFANVAHKLEWITQKSGIVPSD